MSKTLLVLIPLIAILSATVSHAQQNDTLQYVVVMKNGDSFRGNVVGATDSTIIVRTEFGSVEILKRLIDRFVEREGPYLRRPNHFLMPTASPSGPGGFISNYELGFFYGGFGLGYGATITGGITLVPSVSFRKQLFHVGAKFTIERTKEMELALGAAFTYLTLDYPYSHIYGVGTFPLGAGRYSMMLFYRTSGREIAPIELQAFGADTTKFTLFYEGSLGAAFGFDVPAFGRDDMAFVGEIWNNDVSKPQNTAGMIGVRVSNETLSADFGVAIFTAPAIVPVTSFTWRF